MSSLSCYLRKHAEAFKGHSADFCAFAMNRKFAGQLFFFFLFFGTGCGKDTHDLKGHFLAATDGSLGLWLPGECGELRATLTSRDNDGFIPPPPDSPDCLRMTPQKNPILLSLWGRASLHPGALI